MLVLVHYLRSLVQQNLLQSTTRQNKHYSKFWRIYQQSEPQYIGSGSFRKLSGAAESITFNPDEKQMLFSFAGAGTENTTAREISQSGLFKASGEAGVLVRFPHTGEGTISVSGDAHTTRARDFIGSGFIPTLSGAAESLTFNPDEKQMLFSFHGERIAEKITARELGTPGKFTLQGTSGDPLLTFAEQPFVNIDVDGIGTSSESHQAGSGTLFGFENGDEAYARAPYQHLVLSELMESHSYKYNYSNHLAYMFG